MNYPSKFELFCIISFLFFTGVVITGCGADETATTKQDTQAWSQFDYISSDSEGEVKLFNKTWMGCEFIASTDEVRAALSDEPAILSGIPIAETSDVKAVYTETKQYLHIFVTKTITLNKDYETAKVELTCR